MTRQTPRTARHSTIWSQQEDGLLKDARSRGMGWQPIADRYFPRKTFNACRKRHERIMKDERIAEFDGVRALDLARAYMECRERMWQILADLVGERWDVVEEKCMEKGTKNMKVMARQAGGNSPDSGIGLGEHDAWGESPALRSQHDPRAQLQIPQQHGYPQYFHALPHERPTSHAMHEPRGPSIQSMLSTSQQPRGYDWSPHGAALPPPPPPPPGAGAQYDLRVPRDTRGRGRWH